MRDIDAREITSGVTLETVQFVGSVEHLIRCCGNKDTYILDALEVS